MFEYKGTDKFDIGAGYGEYEYDFFTVNGNDDFWILINHYRNVYRRFGYIADKYETIKNNAGLSPVVQVKMNEHNANLCLSLLDEEFLVKKVSIRRMVVNEVMPDGIYNTHIFNFYYFALQSAKDYFESGLDYAKSDLHNAAIKCFSYSIKLSPSIAYSYFYRGLSYLLRKRYDKAIEDFTHAIRINPEDSDAFSLRGRAYKEAGDFDKANADLAKALEIDPDNKIAKEFLEEINRE